MLSTSIRYVEHSRSRDRGEKSEREIACELRFEEFYPNLSRSIQEDVHTLDVILVYLVCLFYLIFIYLIKLLDIVLDIDIVVLS
jgi:hypothetical protein